MMLVAQCASLRLMRVLGILGPHDKMTAEVVQKFMAKFKTPLMEEEIAGLAALTRLDPAVLCIAAGM